MMKKWLAGLAAALVLCAAGCSAQTTSGKTDTMQAQTVVTAQKPSKDTLTMVVIPQSEEALWYCLGGVRTGTMGFHNNEKLTALIDAYTRAERAAFRLNGYFNGEPAECEIVYDGVQFTFTIYLLSQNGEATQVGVLHYSSLIAVSNGDGMTVGVYLTDCLDAEQMLPYVQIGTIWEQSLIDAYNAYHQTYDQIG